MGETFMNIMFDFPLSEGEFVDEFESRIEGLLLDRGRVISSGIATLGIEENGIPGGEKFFIEIEISDEEYVSDFIRRIEELVLPKGAEMYVGEEKRI